MRPLSRRQFLTSAIGAAGALSWSRSVAWPSSSDRPFNVLIVVLDTVRYDRFSQNNFARVPALHQFAQQGVNFSNAWANSSWSLPSQATILTGVPPYRHDADWPDLSLRPAVPTLAGFLAQNGYVAGAFSSNSAWITPEYLGRDFLRFQAYTFENHLRRTTQGRVLNRIAERLGFHSAGIGRKAPTVNAQFLRFLDAYPDRPFFGYVCHMDVNQAFNYAQLDRPFWSPAATLEEILGAYDAALTQLDMQMSELLGELRRRGELDRTIVVVTSDHGESFGKGHDGDHEPSGHGTSLYPEQIRVPLMIVAPGLANPGRVIDTPVSLAAIPFTICRLLGIEMPQRGFPLPLDSSWPASPEGAVLATLRYAEYDERALVTDRWFYRKNRVTNVEELYDVVSDPLARTDLSATSLELPALRAKCEELAAASAV